MISRIARGVIAVGCCPACGTDAPFYGDFDPVRRRVVRRCAACDVPAVGEQFFELYAADELGYFGFEVSGTVSPEGGCGGGCSSGGCAACDHVESCTKIH